MHRTVASDHLSSASTIGPTMHVGTAPPMGGPADPATASSPARQSTAWWASLSGGVSRSARATLESLVAVRDAIAGLPPVPTYAWIGVAALLVLLRSCRSVALRRIVNRGRPAPRRVRELVREMSELMGLNSPPATLTTEARVSPMVWCGARPKLVIPEDLWSSLDDDSRRAVIAHELAHLKRRDHLLHWVAALVGAAYWWHPAAWWARRRMNEEAEASCDAWVTSLFPCRRRAYAEALLVTSSFLGSPAYHAGPALGVVNGRTKLARRITMVMTQRTAPNASRIGVIVASLVLAAGALVTPGLACPPEKEAKATTAPRAAKATGSSGSAESGAFLGEAPAIDAMIQAEKARAEKAKSKNKSKKKQPGQPTTLMPGQAGALSDAIVLYRERAASADELARASVTDRTQIEQAEELARVYAELATTQGAHAAPQAERAAQAYSDAIRRTLRSRGPSTTTAVPSQPMAPSARVAPVAPTPPSAMNPLAGTAPRVRSFDAFGGAATMSAPAEGTEPREYRLPAGKLEALSELMARQDVPIWIERGQGKIVVCHARAARGLRRVRQAHQPRRWSGNPHASRCRG
jgi:beta-lactamase regulating signal transducer with metallopeptidase domain